MLTVLTALILPKSENPCIGEETGRYHENGISVFWHINGTGSSKRYVYSIDGKIVSGIQLMIRHGHVLMANAYTLPEYQKRGYASKLTEKALKQHPKLVFSDDRSTAGKKFVKNFEKNQTL